MTVTYRDPLPDDPVYEDPTSLALLAPERAQFYRQRDVEYKEPRWMNTAARVVQGEIQVRLFEKLDNIAAAVERLASKLP